MKLRSLEITLEATEYFYCALTSLVRNPVYVFLNIVLIMPINGYLIGSGKTALGVCLILAQVVWAFGVAMDSYIGMDD